MALTNRRDKRKQAYQFICKKLQDLDYSIYNTSKDNNTASIISLTEIENLKRGYSDPSEELVAILRKLLHQVVSEEEIKEYLITPLLPRGRLSK